MGLSRISWSWDYLIFPHHWTISYLLSMGLSRIYWTLDYLVFTEHGTISFFNEHGTISCLLSMGLSRNYWAWDYLVFFNEHETLSCLLIIGFSRILLFLLTSYSCLFKTNCAFIWLAVSNIYIYIYTLRCFHIRSFTYMHYCNN